MTKPILGLTEEQLADRIVACAVRHNAERRAKPKRTGVVKSSRLFTLLADALLRYGAHDLECSTDGCTCGFDGALAFAKFATDAPLTKADIKRTKELAKQHGWADAS